MNEFRRKLSTIPAAAIRLLVLLLVAACSSLPGPQAQVSGPMSVPPDMVVIVGKIELHPPLQPGEQMLRTRTGEEFRDAFILYAGDTLTDLDKGPPASFAGSFLTTLDEEFFIKIDRMPVFHVSGGLFYTVYDPPAHIVAPIFASHFMINILPGDDAVYIGTIQYYRDEKNQLRSVMIRDDYGWAKKQFEERFGVTRTLRKSLVTVAH